MDNTPLSPELLVPRLGESLVQKEVISAADLERALLYQEQLRTRGEYRLIGQVLVDLHIIDVTTLDAEITERLVQLRSALQDANDQLERRVQERTAELQTAMEKLSELNQLKNNMVANISHELRTPLTHLKGYLELLLEADLGPLTDAQKNALSIMGRSADRLGRLIEDLILFSLSEREKLNLHLTSFSIPYFCDQIMQRTLPKATERDIRLVTNCGLEPVEVVADEEKIAWVVSHLLENALKFSTPGGTITLSAVRESGRQVRISVQDTGIGIPSTRMSEIFELFRQLDGSTTRKFGGTGLGLALAKKIVEAHASSIEVTSEVGKGSCFSFCLKSASEKSPNASGDVSPFIE